MVDHQIGRAPALFRWKSHNFTWKRPLAARSQSRDRPSAGEPRSPTRWPDSSRLLAGVRRRGPLAISLKGELDIATAPALEKLLGEVERERWSTVVFDLRRLSFMDSSGIPALLGANERIRGTGGRIVFRHASRHVRRTLAAIGIDHILDLTDPRMW